MDWLKSVNDFIRSNVNKVLLPATAMGGLTFLGNLFIALSDGSLDSTELHQLLTGANGAESLLLLMVMLAMKRSKDDKPKQ